MLYVIATRKPLLFLFLFLFFIFEKFIKTWVKNWVATDAPSLQCLRSKTPQCFA
jgi:formate-dependent nitrite reductase membrane component NrfD